MDLKHLDEIRGATQQTRRGPRPALRRTACFDTGWWFEEEVGGGVVDLLIEATNAHGQPADWFDDLWWTDVLQKCTDASVTIEIAPTPSALLHPLILHQLTMIRRVMPHWRIVGHAYLDDLTSEEQIGQLVLGPYHEVRFVDRARSPATANASPSSRRIEELFARIREGQNRCGSHRPVLVRLPATHNAPPSAA
jgi:hypothetical protein